VTQVQESGLPEAVAARLKAVVGPRGYLDEADAMAPYLRAWRDNWTGDSALVLRPDTTQQVADLVAICAQTGTPIVPQGGNTGLTGASQPHAQGREVVLSTARLNRVRDLDPLDDTITVEAGVVLGEIQAQARAVDRLFPLSLAAEGSCQIGGNLSTNAGGTQVLRYGNARALVLGLEVVLPDGRVWDGLRRLRKDNTGYDLKQLFIGAEGTLGVITAAVLRLFPRPAARETAMVALPDPQTAVHLLHRVRRHAGDGITAFELLRRENIDYVLETLEGHGDPFAEVHPWYVLLDLDGQDAAQTRRTVETALEDAFEAGLIQDAVLAENAEQAQKLWALREQQAEAQQRVGVGIKHDISVPISRVPAFLESADAALEAAYPGLRPCAFGHLGDGNIHYNPIAPPDWDGAAFAAERPEVNRIVHDLVASYGGSISAEHGLGRLRLAEAERYKSPVELELMRTMKRALDPTNIMNPGKLVRI
jgi:FAD/FMN-containing dehydrogenase